MAKQNGPYLCELCSESFEKRSEKAGHKRHHHPATREKLLDDIHRVNTLVKGTPTANDFEKHGHWSVGTVARLFGSWLDALEVAGYRPEEHHSVSKSELLEELHQLARSLGKTPRASDMRSDGRYSVSAFQDAFGSWNDALVEGGYEVNSRTKIPESKLLEAIEELIDQLGSVPTADDMRKYGQFSHRPYFKRWDGWQAAIRAAGYEPVGWPTGPSNHNWKPDSECTGDYYGSNWQAQRQKALARDGYGCQSPGCDLTEESHRERYGSGLHVHHIRPLKSFASDGEIDYEKANSLSNLVSLCIRHHRQWERVSPLNPDIR